MKEAYVSYEVAKLLKEKGFCEENVYCYYQGDYKNDSTDVWMGECKFNWNIYDDSYSAPTQQMALRWLREEKKYYIQVDLDGWALGERSGYYVVISATDRDFEAHAPMEQVFFDTPEDAVESALKYVLTELI